MRRGRIDVICGPMFAGKTDEIIRLVSRLRRARKKVRAFKPKVDDRAEGIESHDGVTLDADPVAHEIDLFYRLVEEDFITDVVVIDEAQFFGDELVSIIDFLATAYNVHIIVGGLDVDFRGKPFGAMPGLMAIADKVTKLDAVCDCGEPAVRSYRISGGVERVQVGGDEAYAPLCRWCYSKRMNHPEELLALVEECFSFRSD